MRTGGGRWSETCETQVVNLWMRETRLPMLWRKQRDELLHRHHLACMAAIKTHLNHPWVKTSEFGRFTAVSVQFWTRGLVSHLNVHCQGYTAVIGWLGVVWRPWLPDIPVSWQTPTLTAGNQCHRGKSRDSFCVSLPQLEHRIPWKAAFRDDNWKTLPAPSPQLIKELHLFWRRMPGGFSW